MEPGKSLFGIFGFIACLFIAESAWPLDMVLREWVATPLAGKKCKSDADENSSIVTCPGIMGYSLTVADSGNVMELLLTAADGSSKSIGQASSIGNEAEWLTIRDPAGKPRVTAIIVPVGFLNEEENTYRSELWVIDIEKGCITAKVPPAAKQRKEAKRKAGNSLAESCVEAQ